MRKNIDINKKPTSEQIEMLKKACNMPTSTDDEYFEFNEDELKEFHRVLLDRSSKRR